MIENSFFQKSAGVVVAAIFRSIYRSGSCGVVEYGSLDVVVMVRFGVL